MRRWIVIVTFLIGGEAVAQCGCQSAGNAPCQEETLQTAAAASSSQSTDQSIAVTDFGDSAGWELALIGLVLVPPIVSIARRRARRNRLVLLYLPRAEETEVPDRAEELPFAA